MPNEQEEFLKEFEPKSSNNDPFEQPLTPEEPPVEIQPTEESEGEKFNRRERRLQAKLQAERESAIALAARLEALTEAQKTARSTEKSSYEEKLSKIYGTDTPENATATELLIASVKEAKEAAKYEALEAFRAEQAKEREQVQKAEQTLTAMVEDIEDETGITLDDQTQKGFFTLLEKLSPKDSNGNILAYADHNAVWEEYQSRKVQTNNRAKDLSARSMVRPGSSPTTTVSQDVDQRWLIENGII